MSDAAAPEGQAVEVDPAVSGQVEAPPTQSEQPPPQAEPEYLNIDDEMAQRHVRVRVDGEEVSVPLSEALQGYQRQAAFTQHSQQLAEQRREAEDAIRLHQAMRSNPGLTVQVLANQMGMSVEQYLGLQARQAAAAAQDQAPAPPEFDDPLERELYEERQARLALEQRFTQRESDEQLARAVYGLQQAYGFNEDQLRTVVGVAMQNDLGVEHLPMVAQALLYQGQSAAQAQAEQARQVEEQQRQQQAAAAQAAISNGTGVVEGTSAPAAGYSSYREAIAAAYDEVERRHS